MNSPDNEFAMDFEVMRAAAQRWRSEDKSRTKKVTARKDGQLEKVESKKRIGKRIQYLLDKVRQSRAVGDPVPHKLESMLEKGEDAAEEGDSVTLERVLGQTRDFLSIDFLEAGSSRAAASDVS